MDNDLKAAYPHVLQDSVQYVHQAPPNATQQWSQPHMMAQAHPQAGYAQQQQQQQPPQVQQQTYADPNYYGHPHGSTQPPSTSHSIPGTSSGLSVNMSALSVAGSSSSSSAPAMSPVDATSPVSALTPQQGGFPQHSIHQTFRFAPPDAPLPYDRPQPSAGPHPHPLPGAPSHYDITMRRPPGSSRSSSSSEKSVPRKRSLTVGPGVGTPLTVSVEEDMHLFDRHGGDLLTPGSIDIDDSEMGFGLDNNSPIDGSPSSGDNNHDELRLADGAALGPLPNAGLSGGGPGCSFGVLGKTSATNNFVTKLYQMISDPKSSRFIAWTELGTSFVVSNIGEFSRSILGSHFKHNNFSSFVRQLNMYGFHKINRTPRAQRSSTDAQTWEFSHPKFLRGRKDLLEDIKRKALDQDMSLKQRIELPAEVASQLSRLNEEHRKTVRALHAERAKVERLAQVCKAMYDVMANSFPGQLPIAFPTELLDSLDKTPILITSHSHSHSVSNPHPSPPHPSQNHLSAAAFGFSPQSSPTTADFGFAYPAPPSTVGPSETRAVHTPLPPSPGSLDAPMVMESGGPKRQRTGKTSRARSDSAPLGYTHGMGHPYPGYTPGLGRPRSGSNLAGRIRRDETVISPPPTSFGALRMGELPMHMVKDEAEHNPD